tara:strand:- start:280 stop:432 length:153 start_codon:yes stop_codon:yes gene_type:complete
MPVQSASVVFAAGRAGLGGAEEGVETLREPVASPGADLGNVDLGFGFCDS